VGGQDGDVGNHAARGPFHGRDKLALGLVLIPSAQLGDVCEIQSPGNPISGVARDEGGQSLALSPVDLGHKLLKLCSVHNCLFLIVIGKPGDYNYSYQQYYPAAAARAAEFRA
jgi:hypothetical protein